MTFLAPGFLYAAVAAALATVALHLIVAREPRAVALPTARFVPVSGTEALVRARRFSDPWLLAVRVLLLLLIGAALAHPVRVPQRERIARVIVADRSDATLSDAEVRDSVRMAYRPGDAIVAFDSSAWSVQSPDSLGPRAVAVPGSISAALVQAQAAASRIRSGTDSIELIVISPLLLREVDRATAQIRATWPGRARVLRVAADTSHPAAATLITWNTRTRPPRAVARRSADTAGAVVAGGDVLVAPFARAWLYPRDSLRDATVVARWVDGEPAAIEWRTGVPTGASCARSIAIPIDSTGDLVLRPELLRLRNRLLGACGTVALPPTPATLVHTTQDSLAHILAGAGPLARASAFPPAPSAPSTITPWLVAAAVVVALAELALRRRRAGAAR